MARRISTVNLTNTPNSGSYIVMDATPLRNWIDRNLDESVATERQKAAFDAITKVLRDDARDQFNYGGNPAWKQSARSTIKRKMQAGSPLAISARKSDRLSQYSPVLFGFYSGASTILIQTGQLRDSWVNKSNPQHIERFNQGTGDWEFGTSNPVAWRMQESQSNRGGSGTRPARPVVFSRETIKRATDAASEILTRDIRKRAYSYI